MTQQRGVSGRLVIDGPALWLGGATGVGKSAVALEVAQALDAEIVSVDSMQVYRGLDIGTAKPSSEERQRIPHHLIDVVELTEQFSAAHYVERVQCVVKELHKRGKTIVFCGGTGLYYRALLEGLGQGPAPHPELRDELERRPLTELLAELQAQDPSSYDRIDRCNPRRVIRAVELLRLTGRTGEHHRSRWEEGPAAAVPGFFLLRRSPEDLRQRIEGRIEAMLEAGWVEETRLLLDQGLRENRVAMQAIGYRQIVEHLEGQRDHEETRRVIRQKTWQFARRQRNWFEGQLRASPLEVAPGEAAGKTAERLIRSWRLGERTAA